MFLSYEVLLAVIALVFYMGRCSKSSPTERIIQVEKPVEVIREVKVETVKEKIVEVAKPTTIYRCNASCITDAAKELYKASEPENGYVDCDDLDEQETAMDMCQARMTKCVELAIQAHQALGKPE